VRYTVVGMWAYGYAHGPRALLDHLKGWLARVEKQARYFDCRGRGSSNAFSCLNDEYAFRCAANKF